MELSSEKYDIVIIGGGCVGSGIALDATLRGYNVILLEKNDFGSGASSKSSKLVHGGVRYLEKAIKQMDKAQYDLVKEGIKERAIFLKNAPSLTKKLKINIPIYSYLKLIYTYLGLLIYKLMAKRSYMWGGTLKENDIVTTSGSIDAISFCMLTLTEKGDTIAVESPVYFGILHLAKNLGLNVLELPTNPITGIDVEALRKALQTKKIKLCLLVSNFSNPMGCCMPDENKKEVVKLMEKFNVPLIEDDLFGDLFFGKHRPSCCKTFDESGIVLLCSSFSKTLAPGYRVGWMVPGKFKEKVARTKYYHSLYTTSITHEAVGSFLENDRYENHLRKLRQTLHRNSLQFLRCISQYFPDDTKVTSPQGGLHLWVELNKNANTIELYNTAMANKISIAPGRMFTLQNQYNNCLKLNYGLLWDDKVEGALKQLGKLCSLTSIIKRM